MKPFSFLIIFLILSKFTFGTTNIDSLKTALQTTTHDTLKVKTLIALWEATAYSNMDEAMHYSHEALNLSLKSNDTRGLAESYHRIAITFNNQGAYDSATFYYNKSIELAQELNDIAMEANVLNAMGIVYYSQGIYGKAILYAEEALRKLSEIGDEEGIAQGLSLLGNINFYSGNYQEALKYHIQSLKIMEKGDDEARLADGMVYLASTYQALDKPEKGLEYLRKASEIYKRINDQYYLAQAYNNIGFTYNKQGAKDSAKFYYELAIEQCKLSNNNGILNLAYMNMGNIYKAQEKYDLSLEYFNKSLQLGEKHNDKVIISETYNNIGILSALQGKYDEALLNFNIAKKVALEVGSKDNLQSIYRNMSEAYEDLHNFDSALTYYKLYSVVKDSMFNENKTQKIEEMEARFEHDKKEKAIALQQTEIELLSKDLEVQTVKRNGLLIGLICSILGGIYVIVSLRWKMKQNKLIREQERKLEEEKLMIAQLERDNYEKELAYKKNELTTHALHMIQKNELLDTLKENIGKLEMEDHQSNSMGYRSLKRIINGSVQIDKDWENFNRHFEQVHHGFYSKLKEEHETLTSNDLRLSAMLRMNLSSKEVAAIMNVTPESVKKARYRLRKKLQLEEEADLHSFMMKV